MVRKSVILFLVMMVVLVGLVRAGDAKEGIVSRAKGQKGIKAKKITWKKDGAKMVFVKPYVPAQYKEKSTFVHLFSRQQELQYFPLYWVLIDKR